MKFACGSLVCHAVGIHNVSYPRVDPSVICAVISSDNERCLLVRKPVFPPKLYSLVSGFTDAGILPLFVTCLITLMQVCLLLAGVLKLYSVSRKELRYLLFAYVVEILIK